MKLKRLFLLFCCVFVLTVMVTYPVYASHKHKVQSSALTPQDACRGRNCFRTSEDVYARGQFFPPNSNVDIYVTANRVWSDRDSLAGTDVSFDGVNTVTTDNDGKIPCTNVAVGLIAGGYDIVVDANQDGTFDTRDGDAVDGKTVPGLRVREGRCPPPRRDP